jgi:SAM-dependent methyltransferase
MIAKATLKSFLSKNPFPRGWTDGLFYREKMRAIHRVAPAGIKGTQRILEVGGGRSGLAYHLYPGAKVVTLDINPELGHQQPNNAKSSFICGNACLLPFADASFDVVTLFDVLEHVNDDQSAAREALRVLSPGGSVLVSTPEASWRYPYFRFMRKHCPTELELMNEWGHVRRGYKVGDLVHLFGGVPQKSATFINPVTAFFHDVAFSRLSLRRRKILYAIAGPITLVSYLLHQPSMPGTETAFEWRA